MSVGLVLEGGGQRGAYTAGVLQGLYSEGIRVDYVAGVSAGALTGINYVSGQLRRNYTTFVSYSSDPRYMGIKNMKQGGFFNFDFLLGDLVRELLPFDFDAFFGSSCRMRIGTTDCMTGEAVYYDKEALMDDANLTVLRATASLPLVAKPQEFGGRILMDGGLADPIPLERSIADGNEFNIVVFTRNSYYVDRPEGTLELCRRKYPEYKGLISVMERRAQVCHRQRALAYEQQRLGKAVVIHPVAPIRLSKFERRAEKLAELHDRALFELAPRMTEIRELMERDRLKNGEKIYAG